ncbi:PREDICTED: 39S ribosomal protein L21, mitochondrial isoform X1 [Colobus angolensis palliatus]|uniref:39S ribosomal protein L21, mitochondrial isoform X1 n=1 Tax=Colobus angolensis palliatus TaxID=336983 RepID=UPI0005F41121|nr:PREDICTED: 39S ribosomal protein L21, mitochondrial isoform X1 [Colobus angolensis palliatus]
MAAAMAASPLTVTLGRLVSACSRSILRPSGPGAASLWSASGRFNSQSTSFPPGYVPRTSLSSPPWPEVVLPDLVEETRRHAEVVRRVNELIATGQYGRLFAVVHFASRQWKVTSEDLILVGNELDLACGERIRLEKVLLVGADNFTLLGKPLLRKDLVRVEATVIEKTESWPRIIMRFRKRKNFKKKRSKLEKVSPGPAARCWLPRLMQTEGVGHVGLSRGSPGRSLSSRHRPLATLILEGVPKGPSLTPLLLHPPRVNP